jgi:hypothetical protein
MNEKRAPHEGDLPPVPGPDSWSAAEAADWDDTAEEQPSGDAENG